MKTPTPPPISRLRPALPIVLVLVALFPGCGSSRTVVGTGTRAFLSVTIDPTPVVSKPSTTSIGYTNVSYSVKIAEAGGLGGQFVFINATVFDVNTGRSIGINNYDAADLLVFVGSKRLEAHASVDVKQQIDFLIPTVTLGTRLTVAVQFRDDNGSVLNQAVLIDVV